MALIDKIKNDDGEALLSAHDFSGGMLFLWDGDFTLAEFKTFFGLEAEDNAQLNTLQTAFQALPDDMAKLKWIIKFEKAMMWFQTGLIDKAKFADLMGL